MEKTTPKIGKAIHFHFHPKGFEENEHAVTKADSQGRKRRYICGISSGLEVDAHGERMSQKCIKSFMDQANKGDLLLFPDIHGIKETQDIGMLEKAEILGNGDWYTEYKLYDEHDEIGAQKLENADTAWKQINGLPPYRSKRQKGFSIEGIIPDESIIMNSQGEPDRSVIDDILLDGVVLVPRPAYRGSIATSIYKALGEVTPHRANSIKSYLRDNLIQSQASEDFYQAKWEYQDALENMIEHIMKRQNTNKPAELGYLFDEYKALMIELITRSEIVFADKPPPVSSDELNVSGSDQITTATIEDESDMDPELDLLKSLHSKLSGLKKSMENNNVKK